MLKIITYEGYVAKALMIIALCSYGVITKWWTPTMLFIRAVRHTQCCYLGCDALTVAKGLTCDETDELTGNHTYLVTRSRMYVQMLHCDHQCPREGWRDFGQTNARDMPLERVSFLAFLICQRVLILSWYASGC